MTLPSRGPRSIKSDHRFFELILARLDWLGQALTEHQLLVVTAFSILYFGAVAFQAARRLFWYDELFTVYICKLPDLRAIWAALKGGADLNPPGFYVLTRITQSIVGPGHLGTRLPAVVGYWVFSIALFLFLKRRVSISFALTGMLLPVLTPAYTYAEEARPYGIILGCAGVALVCWQRAAEHRRRTLALSGLGLAVATALLSHCYAVLLAVPFALGEGIRTIQRRSVDWSIWLVLLLGAWPALMYPKLLSANNQFVQHAGPFTPTFASIPTTYFFLLQSLFAKVLLAFVVMTLLLAINTSMRASNPDRSSFPIHEVGALFGFALIPFAAVFIGMRFSHIYFTRYSLPAIIGLVPLLCLALAIPKAIAPSLGPATALLFGFFALLAAGREFHAVQRVSVATSVADLTDNKLISAAARTGLPVVITDPQGFLELDHYGDSRLLSNLFYLTNSDAAVHYFGTNVFDIGYPVISRWFPIRAHVQGYNIFLREHHHFMVYASGPPEWDYIVHALISSGNNVRLIDWSGSRLLYKVATDE